VWGRGEEEEEDEEKEETQPTFFSYTVFPGF
jgi:hypothetical protein